MSASIFPLTDGLLVSMAFRYDHSFGFEAPPEVPADLIQLFGHTKESRKQIIVKMREYYAKFSASDCQPPEYGNDNTELQLFEEVSGEGFYSTGRESTYADSFPR